jgi:hypothetical protein
VTAATNASTTGSSAEPTPEATVPAEATVAATQAATQTGGLRSAHIRVIGDVMFHAEQLDMAKQSDGTYNFDLQFKFIKDSLAAADYTIANLETTVGKYKSMPYSGYPQFNTPESALQTLKDCGIDFFTLANTCLDLNTVSLGVTSLPSFEKLIFVCAASILQFTILPELSTNTAATIESVSASPSLSPASVDFATDVTTAKPVFKASPDAGAAVDSAGAAAAVVAASPDTVAAVSPEGVPAVLPQPLKITASIARAKTSAKTFFIMN